MNLKIQGGVSEFGKDSRSCRRWIFSVAVVSAINHKRQSVTAKREKSQTPKVLTAVLTLPNLT